MTDADILAQLDHWIATHTPATDHDRRVVEGPVTTQDDERVTRMRWDLP